MAWQGQQILSVGNGNGNGDGNSQASQPQGTEYTLQGVMRFLQTEWHRHERDRNAWEIERQEMRVRIASLEGSGRRADNQTKGLRKYINMLEKTLATERRKSRSGQTNGVTADTETEDKKADENEKLDSTKRPSLNDKKPYNSFLATGLNIHKPSPEDDDPQRLHLKNFLEGMAGEFTYLMVSGANPPPPHEAPQHQMQDIGQAQSANLPTRQSIEDAYIPKQQQMDLARLMQEDDRQAMLERERSANLAQQQRRMEQPQAQPMQREQPQRQIGQPPNYWAENQKPQPTTQPQQQQQQQEEEVSQVNHVFDGYGRELNSSEIEVRKEGVTETETDDWDFGDAEIKPMPIVVTSRGDTDAFPTAQVEMPAPKSPGRNAQRRRSSVTRRQTESEALEKLKKEKEDGQFKVRFGLRGHLDVVRAVIFTGGGSPGEPELATAGDDGVIKRWIVPSRYPTPGSADNGGGGNGALGQQRDDMDIPPSFTHRGHSGSVLSLTAWHPSIHQSFAPGAPRAQGEGWIISGGQDASIRVWERGRVDPKATIEGHTDAVWAVCVLPSTCGQIFGTNSSYGSPERILLVSGSADATVKVWSVSAPPTLPSPTGSAGRRGGRQRGNSMSSGSAFPNTPQPSIASNTPFTYTLIHSLTREGSDASPTSIVPLGPGGESFCVSYNDAAVLVFDTRTGEELSSMASTETYDGTIKTAVNAIVTTTSGLDSSLTFDAGRGGVEEMDAVSGATGSSRGVEGTVITGHEDCFIRFFDANSGQCTYNMLAHPSSISSLSLSPDGRELVSAGHDASLRFWSLEKRACVLDVAAARVMRGEGVTCVSWSGDGRTVVGGGGDGVVKVFCR